MLGILSWYNSLSENLGYGNIYDIWAAVLWIMFFSPILILYTLLIDYICDRKREKNKTSNNTKQEDL